MPHSRNYVPRSSTKYGSKLVSGGAAFCPSKAQSSCISKPTKRNPCQLASGIVGLGQLRNIHNLVNEKKSITHGETKSQSRATFAEPLDSTDTEQHAITNKVKYPSGDQELIDSVLRQVIEANKDKLPRESLIRVLSSVYSNAESILGNNRPDPDLNCSHHEESSQHQAPNSEAENVQTVVSCPPDDPPKCLSITERKKIQWARERAELAALNFRASGRVIGTQMSGSITVRQQSHGDQSSVLEPVQSSSMPSTLKSRQMDGVSSSCTTMPFTPTLTTLGFTMNHELEDKKREAQRRHWLNELDEQVRERRLAQSKAVVNPPASSRNMLHQSKSLDEPTETNPCKLESHPSASHFYGAVPSFTDESCPDSDPQKQLDSGDAGPQKFNRIRGFTGQLYSDPTEEAARRRSNEEILRANLQMMEEKRRLREAEKAQKLLEDRSEWERQHCGSEETHFDSQHYTNETPNHGNAPATPKFQTNYQQVSDPTRALSRCSDTCGPPARLPDRREISMETLDSVMKDNAECQTDILMQDLVISGPAPMRNNGSVSRQSKTQNHGKSITKQATLSRPTYPDNRRDPKSKQLATSSVNSHTTKSSCKLKQATQSQTNAVNKKPISNYNTRETLIRTSKNSNSFSNAVNTDATPGRYHRTRHPYDPTTSEPLDDFPNVVRTQDTLHHIAAVDDCSNQIIPSSNGANSTAINSLGSRERNIMHHLSEIRKSLQKRQMRYESGTYDSGDE